MIGLIAVIVLAVLLILFVLGYKKVKDFALKGGSDASTASVWGIVGVLMLSLPITWDAIPTWIAFQYYARAHAGITVFKTLDQWKKENPGVAETLEPYGFFKDKRSKFQVIAPEKYRYPMSARFAYDEWTNPLFLSVRARRHEIVDTKTGEVLISYSQIVSGNSGGLATGGGGWWAFWLINQTDTEWRDYKIYSDFREAAKNLGVNK